MADFLLFPVSVMVYGMLHHFLKRIFVLVEKAHEHLCESDRRTSGGELVKGRVI